MPIKKHLLSLAKTKYSRHKSQSKFRNIDFLFTFEEWYQWWLSYGIDKNIDQKWSGGNRPCMCRIGDRGPYEISNVYFALDNENIKDCHKNGKANPQGSKSKIKFRYGNEYFTRNDFLTKYPYLKEYELRFYKLESYDENNKKESLKLKKQWEKIPYELWWETDIGCFPTLKDAADFHGLKYSNLQGKFERAIEGYKKGKKIPLPYKKIKIKRIGSLEQYIQKNSRYIDPYLI